MASLVSALSTIVIVLVIVLLIVLIGWPILMRYNSQEQSVERKWTDPKAK